MSKSNVRTSVTVSERRRCIPNPLEESYIKSWRCQKNGWKFENSNSVTVTELVAKWQTTQKMSLKIWIFKNKMIRPKSTKFLVHLPNTKTPNKKTRPRCIWEARMLFNDFPYVYPYRYSEIHLNSLYSKLASPWSRILVSGLRVWHVN